MEKIRNAEFVELIKLFEIMKEVAKMKKEHWEPKKIRAVTIVLIDFFLDDFPYPSAIKDAYIPKIEKMAGIESYD